MILIINSRELERPEGRAGKGVLQEQETISRENTGLRDGWFGGQGQDVCRGIQREVAEWCTAVRVRPLPARLHKMHK